MMVIVSTSMHLDAERCYRAVASRDSRFDGMFLTGVRTTGIYCRPSCPAITPRRRNVEFIPLRRPRRHAGVAGVGCARRRGGPGDAADP
jgi:AraC family transcriptional regulator of adaptative response / DNA-3-methyladenine glycosylase II